MLKHTYLSTYSLSFYHISIPVCKARASHLLENRREKAKLWRLRSILWTQVEGRIQVIIMIGKKLKDIIIDNDGIYDEDQHQELHPCRPWRHARWEAGDMEGVCQRLDHTRWVMVNPSVMIKRPFLVRLMEETREIANIWDFACHQNSKQNRTRFLSMQPLRVWNENCREVLEGYLNGILISVFSICILFLCPQYSGDPYQNDAGYQSVSNISDVWW